MKRRMGFYAAIGAAICTILFGIFLILGFFTPTETLSYMICMVLSWCYVLLVCDLCADTLLPERKAFAYAGLAFSVMYAVFVNIVYFTQITVIRQNTISPEIIEDFRMIPGTLFFAYDMLGYAFMGLSSLFIAWIVRPKNKGDVWMKRLFAFHGIFFPLCVIMPMTWLFGSAGSSDAGSLLLIGWCAFFASIMILAARYVGKAEKQATSEARV